MNVGRIDATGTLLRDGRVLVVGGLARTPAVCKRARSCSTRGLAAGRAPAASGHPGGISTATLLPDGTVLVAGGSNGEGWLRSVELY